MNELINNSINTLYASLIGLLSDINNSRENPDQCIFDFQVEPNSFDGFTDYIFTRKKDEAKIAFVIVYDTSEFSFSHLMINGERLPSVFLDSHIIKPLVINICEAINEIVAENQLQQSVSFITPLIEEFFQDLLE